MCAILDNNVCSEVFAKKPKRTPAGEGFLDWLNSKGHLVSGGKNKCELDGTNACRDWLREAVLAGRATLVDDHQVDHLQLQLEDENACVSDDAHIIALAQVSGARLLYSNDGNLKKDFGNRDLIAEPRGKVFSTKLNSDFSRHRRRLLNQSHCRRP